MSDRNQASNMIKYDDWIFPGSASHCEFIASLKMQTAAVYAQASIRARLFLRLKMQIVSSGSTLRMPYRMYDGHTVSHALYFTFPKHYNQLALPRSHYVGWCSIQMRPRNNLS